MIQLLLSLLLAQTPAAQPADAQMEPATLRGRVTDKQTGAPIAGAVVRIGRMNSTDPPVPPARTTSDGRFEFTGLRPGTYSGFVSPDRHRPTHIPNYTLGGNQGRTTLKPGEIREDVDITLDRSLTIPVRVVDESGEPLAGVHVSAAPVGQRSATALSRRFGRNTNDQGRQRVFQLPPGRYIVCAEPGTEVEIGGERRDAERFLRTCYPSTGSEDDAQPVRLTDGDSGEIEIRMRRGRTFKVSGSVLDPRGAVPQNARLQFHTFHSSGVSGMTTSLDADGRFTIANVVPGDYAVEVTTGGPMRPDQRQPLEVGYQPITISAADVDGLVITMTKGVDAAGRFVLEDTDAPFLKPGGSGLMLTGRLVNDELRGQGSSNFARVREDRTFEFQGIFGKRWFSIANVPAGWYMKAIRYAGKDIIDEGAELKPGTDPELFEVVLSHRGPTITGRVTEALGNPVPRARVLVVPTTLARWSPFGMMPIYTTQAGTYRAGPMRHGEYVVIALDPKNQQFDPADRGRLRELMKSGERISLGAGEEHILDLRAFVPER